jgi:serine/threonine protein kinase
MTEPHNYLIGKLLQDRYRLERRLGEGGFGSVYEARDSQSERQVAIKILRASVSNDSEVLGRFARDIRIITALQHPNMVQIYDHGKTSDGIQWIAFELIRGINLAERIAQSRLSEAELLPMLLQVLRALSAVHAQGIVHRDLTPKNIMLQESTPKLVDFGIASLRSDETLTASTMVSGTPCYMSPEQWQGLKFATHRSDLYSLGIIAYEALVGKLPFQAKSPISWMRAHCHTPPTPLIDLIQPNEISAPLQRAIMKSLAKDPAERFGSADEFAAALI